MQKVHTLAWWEVAVLLCTIAAGCWAMAPAMGRFWCRAQQSQVQHTLSCLYATTHWWTVQHGREPTWSELSKEVFSTLSAKHFYTYRLRKLQHKDHSKVQTPHHWRLHAHGLPNTRVEGDEWTVGTRGQLKHKGDVFCK